MFTWEVALDTWFLGNEINIKCIFVWNTCAVCIVHRPLKLALRETTVRSGRSEDHFCVIELTMQNSSQQNNRNVN